MPLAGQRRTIAKAAYFTRAQTEITSSINKQTPNTLKLD